MLLSQLRLRTRYTKTICQRKNIGKSMHANYPILDAIIVSLSTRFSEESLKIAAAVDELFKIKFQQSSFLIDYYKVRCNLYLSNIYKL